MDKLIKLIREKCGLSQEKFAQILGTTPLSINRWENNKTKPNKMAQLQLVNFCNDNNIDVSDSIVEEATFVSNDGELVLYHGSKRGLKGQISPMSNRYCDFGKGFYLGTNPLQPLTLVCVEEKPYFYTAELSLEGLKTLKLGMDLDWAMLIAFYHGYMDEVKGSTIYKKYENMVKEYDVISGYIADDRMYRVMKSFFEKEITDEALLHSLSALDLGYQYVCKTEKACSQVRVLKETELSTFELALLQEKEKKRRQEGIELTERILIDYRRQGKYFDEILRGE